MPLQCQRPVETFDLSKISNNLKTETQVPVRYNHVSHDTMSPMYPDKRILRAVD
jgi:hypothetical protein